MKVISAPLYSSKYYSNPTHYQDGLRSSGSMTRINKNLSNIYLKKNSSSSRIKFKTLLSPSTNTYLFKDITVKKPGYYSKKTYPKMSSNSRLLSNYHSNTIKIKPEKSQIYKSYTERSEIASDLEKYRSQIRVNKLFERISETKRSLNQLAFKPKAKPRINESYLKKYGKKSNYNEQINPKNRSKMRVIGQRNKFNNPPNFRSSLDLNTSRKYTLNSNLIGEKNYDQNPVYESPKKSNLKNQLVYSSFEPKKSSKKIFKKYNSYAKFQNYDFSIQKKVSQGRTIKNDNLKRNIDSLLPSRYSLNYSLNTSDSPYLFRSIQKVKSSQPNDNLNLYESNSKFSRFDDSGTKNKSSYNFMINQKKEKTYRFSDFEIESGILCGKSNGKNKVCQDQVLKSEFDVQNRKYFIFAIFDGHGRFGERISKFLRDNICSILKKEIIKIKNNQELLISALRITANLLHSLIYQISSKINKET
jgi:hypothetical protein